MMNARKSLEEAIERLRRRNEAFEAHLKGKTGISSRPESSLEDATERAKKHWDKLEARHRHSAPPSKLKP